MRAPWVAAGVTSLIMAGCGADGRAPSSAGADFALATVQQRDLVEHEDVDGTLGYADKATLFASGSGTLTRLPRAGRIMRRGRSLYESDGRPTAWLLYGSRPAWRDFTPGMSDGADVRQLERNLAALGYEPGSVDGDWTSQTTAAVRAFQEDRGTTVDGTLSRDEVVFRAGATRIGEVKANLGDRAGGPLATVSSARREVVVSLPASEADLAREGQRVEIELPAGRTVSGVVAEVGKIAREPSGEDGEATIDVRVSVRGNAGGLDQAPVDVALVRERRKGVLTVPVTALLAKPGGGYAVEAADGRLVEVEPGLFADDRVEISGPQVREGMKVRVPE